MKKRSRKLSVIRPASAIAVVLLFGAAGAQAETPDAVASERSVYLGGSVFGPTVGYSQRFSDAWAGRIMFHTGIKGDTEKDKDISGVHYDSKPKLGAGLALLADYYPIQNRGFRITAGLNFTSLKQNLEGRADGSGGYDINGHRYSSAQVGELKGQRKYNNVQPYLGLGWESKTLKQEGWRFTSDLGLLYFGKAKGNLEASGAASNAALRQDLAAESKDLRKNAFGLYLGLGAGYAF